MNRIYRLVWNRQRHVLQVASELAYSRGGAAAKTGRRARLLCAAALGAASLLPLPAWAQSAPGGAGAGGLAGQGGLGNGGGGGGGQTAANQNDNGATGSNGNGGQGGASYAAPGSGGQGGGVGGTSVGNAPATGGDGDDGAAASGSPAAAGGGGGGGAGIYSGDNAITIAANLRLTGGNGGNGGSAGADDTGGGGGGGGAGLASFAANATIGNAGILTGGNGGNGSSGRLGGGGGGGGDGLLLLGANATVSNSGTITGGKGGSGGGGDALQDFGGNAVGGSGVSFAGDGGSLTNSGAIAGGDVQAANSVGGAGVNVNAAGVRVTVTNTGSIVGGTGGAGFNPGDANYGNGGVGLFANGNVSIVNSGDIAGGKGGSANAGGEAGAGIVATAGAGQSIQITNQNGGVIRAGRGGNQTSGDLGGNAITASGHVAIANQAGGSILGNNLGLSDLSFTGSVGIQADNGVSITNAGTIAGTGGANAGTGVRLGGSTLVNQAGGLIEGGNGNADAAGAPGITAIGGASITNAGTIAGGKAGDGAGAQAVALVLVGGGNTLTLLAGSRLIGGAVSGGGDSLVLGGDSNAAAGNSLDAGSVSGFAQYVKNGLSTWTLTGTGNAGQNWTIDNGVLVGNTTSLASAAIVNNAGLQFDQSGPGTFGGAISGSGSLQKTGAGLLVLSGANSYTGNTLVNTGTLALAAGGTAGKGLASVLAGATLDISQTSSGATLAGLVGEGTVALGGRTLTLGSDNLFPTFDGVIADGGLGGGSGGKLSVTGAGRVTLTGANTYSGGTTVDGGTLAVSGSGTLGTSGVAIADGATLDVSLRSNGKFALPYLQGSGRIALGSGTLILGSGIGSSFGGTIADGGLAGGAGAKLMVEGSLALSGANTFTGGTTIDSGVLALQGAGALAPGSALTVNAGGGFDISQTTGGATIGTLGGAGTVNLGGRTLGLTDGSFTGIIGGAGGQLVKQGAGSLVLDGANTYSGLTDVQAGSLIVGDDAHANAAVGGSVHVESGAILGGHGRIGGDLDLAAGGHLSPGASIGTLTVGGNLSAAQGSQLDFEFGAPGADFKTFGASDSVKVNGNLDLQGAVLNIADAGGMGPGLYNLFTYGGTLTESNGGIGFGTTPGGIYALQYLTGSKQVNLLDTTGLTLNFWNANGLANATQLGGGDGTWTTIAPAWTDAKGSVTAAMQPQPGFAIFGGAAGSVAIDGSAGAVGASGLQFVSDGYRLTGDTLTLVGGNGAAPVIRVGDGSSAGASWTATIGNAIAGKDGLTKTDLGTLVLTGANVYTGGTTISGGTLSVSSDANLGDASGALTLDGGTLQVTGTAFQHSSRTLTMTANGAGFDIADAANTFTVDQALGGAGALAKTGAGTLVLSGANTYTGGTTVGAGTLSVGSDANLGGAGGALTLDGGTLQVTGTGFTQTGRALTMTANGAGFDIADAANVFTVGQALSGTGALAKTGAGTLALTGANSYTGGTTVDAGTLQGDSASLQGHITDNASLVFAQDSDGSFAGTIDGSGALAKTGAGTLILDGASTYGGGTRVQAGSLIVGDASHAGASIAGDVGVTGGATLGGHGHIGGNLDLDVGSHLSPGASIGTLTVGANLSAAQGSQLDFEFGAPGPDFKTLGSSDNVRVGGNLDLQGAVLNVTDAGGMGPGLYNLFTYGGTLAESNGGIGFGTTPGGTYTLQYLTGQKQVNLLDTTGLTLNFWNANGLASPTQLGGGDGTWTTTAPAWTDAKGSVTAAMQPQPGFAIFGGAAGLVTVDGSAGAVGASGLQFVSDGYRLTGDTLTLVGGSGAPVIRVGDGSSAGASWTATIGNAIAGKDGLTKTDLGTLVLTGANTYTGGTTVSGGTLSVSSDANLGDAGGALTLDGGTLQVTGTAYTQTGRALTITANGGGFDIADATNVFTVGQALSGTGALAKTGAGTLVLAAANSYTGGTTVDAGTLQGDSTSLQGAITDHAALVFVQHGDGTFAGSLAGDGTLAKTGAGTLTFNGDGSAFTGATTVQAGTLSVGDAGTPAARLGGKVQVMAGASLRGHGSIGGDVVNAGTVWPGGSIGTLGVGGNYTQAANGVFMVDATPDGQASKLAVSGTATLGGGVSVQAQAGNWSPRTDYTILTAGGGVNGRFDSVSSSLAFLTPVLSYTANAVNLELQRNDIDFAAVAQTRNQKAVAAAANPLGLGNPLYDSLVGLDAATARAAFDQLSGEIYASTRTAIADDDRYVRDAINNHLLGTANQADGQSAASGEGVVAWTAAWGRGGSHDADGNAAELHANGSGLLVGADLAVGSGSRIGAAIGSGEASLDVDARRSTAHIVDQHIAVYGSTALGAVRLQGGAIYGWQRIDSNRHWDYGSTAGTASSRYRANTGQLYADASYDFSLGRSTLSPFLNAAYQRLRTDAVHEHGGLGALDAAGDTSAQTYATLGLRGSFALGADDAVRAHASLGWQHAWGDLASRSTLRFASGSEAFGVGGVAVAKDMAALTGGISFWIAPQLSVDATYSGQFGDDARDQSARISLSWLF